MSGGGTRRVKRYRPSCAIEFHSLRRVTARVSGKTDMMCQQRFKSSRQTPKEIM